MNDEIEWPDVDLIALPPMTSTVRAQRYVADAYRRLRMIEQRCDVLFIRMPFQLPALLFLLRKPRVLHFGSDVYECVRASSDYRGVWRPLSLAYAKFGELCFKRQVRNAVTRTVTNGSALHAKYGVGSRGRTVLSSCLHRSELEPLNVRTVSSPPRLLFVGYFRPEKGLPVLLDAFDRLRETRELRLSLAGGESRASGEANAVAERIRRSPFSNDINVLGHVPFGEALFELYRQADVLVLPSHSEGTPRTLVEARAFSCPVVATDVGGVGFSVTDGLDGLLVRAKAPDQLAGAISRVLDDVELRNRLVQNGWKRASGATLECFVDVLEEELDRALSTPWH